VARYGSNTAARRVTALELDVEAAFESCGSSPDALRELVLGHRRSVRWALDAELSRALTCRGHDVRDLCARELTARVDDLNVCELLQTITMGRKDATIDVFHGSLASRIWCTGGEIVDAMSGRLVGEAAVHRIMAVEQGEIVADFRPVRRPRVVVSSTQALMLEALRRKDECAVLEKRLGGVQCVYRSAPGARAKVEKGGLHAALLEAFDGGARVESVLTTSARDDLSMLQAIAQLVDKGALVAADAGPTLVVPPLPSALRVPAANSVPAPPGERLKIDWRVPAGAAAFIVLVLAIVFLVRIPPDAEVPVYTTHARGEEGELEIGPVEADRSAAAVPHGAVGEASPSGDRHDNSYPVRVLVEPAYAQLWLDGRWVATGELSISLGRTGDTHELRIVAPDHHEQTLLFRDTPPPRAVRLIPLDEDGRAAREVQATPPVPEKSAPEKSAPEKSAPEKSEARSSRAPPSSSQRF
jgi:hypothetical protein